MTEADILSFIAICRYKSISRAAEELFISQSSLSLRLKTLEEQLGCPLFLRGRGRREITLTTQGQSFYDLALQYQGITGKMAALGRGDLSESLRVSVISSVGCYLMPEVFHRFMALYPGIRLIVQDMEAELATASILRGKTDLAFSTAKVQTDQIAATAFLADPMTVICAADAPYPDPVSLSRLCPEEELLIHWCADLDFWHDSLFPADMPARPELGLMSQIGPFLERTRRWAFVPESVARILEASPCLRRVSPDFSVPERRIYLLRHLSHSESPAIRCFLDTAAAVLREQGTVGLLL